MWAMDAEWKPFGGYKKQGKMAMVQLGNDSTVFLFHIIHMRSFPKELARILEDSRILKVGINIRYALPSFFVHRQKMTAESVHD